MTPKTETRTNKDILGLSPEAAPSDAAAPVVSTPPQESDRAARLNELINEYNRVMLDIDQYEQSIEAAGYDYNGREELYQLMVSLGRA